MKQNLQNFIAERAEYLAVMYLTRSNDLVIERMKSADYGFDILVTILRDNLPTGRVFGVEVKAQDTAIRNLKDFSLSITQKTTEYLHNVPFPLFLFLFTMEDDKGYYKWLNHVIADSNQVSLQWHSLDENGIRQIVDDVNAWYDAKSHFAA
ncbi:DUF4365 domain-containing protein [Aulosira sp. FACHB-615]|uniref:DUF4365 domain-containing protein n=1 Tax=Aulosira sp. FACHB-615 TaxID=2692777 RepID=UPI0016878453|nr:DUF4365 domain-containing protein [Aulosira sp. FACHB-615]MBD2489753.1 DUF4365 domain-containing protein [Aulosira sp. FACHB-615]